MRSAVITGIGMVTRKVYGRGEALIPSPGDKKMLPDITRKMVLDQPHKPFGRMDVFSRLGFAGICFAMKDAGLSGFYEKRGAGIVASSVLGCLSTDIRYYDTVIPEEGIRTSPQLFAYTLPSCFLGEAAIYFGLTGESFVISEDESLGMSGLHMALDLLYTGDAGFVLCGVNDTERPDMPGLPELSIPGSLFFVLERETRDGVSFYGEIHRNLSGKICLGNNEINNLHHLAKSCLGAQEMF